MLVTRQPLHDAAVTMDVAAEVNKETALEDGEAVVSADDEKPKDADVEAEEAEHERLRREREARAQALTLEIVGDLPYAEVKPPENVLFVCKLNPVTEGQHVSPHTLLRLMLR